MNPFLLHSIVVLGGDRTPRRALSVTLAISAAFVVACGSGDREDPDVATAGGALVHVHGLGINPQDGALYIATHTGLFRVGRGETEPARVGDSTQDTMGFTVVGPDRFLGSGHPGELDNAINPLGLIRSTDSGESWTPVSLEGQADFHILRSSEGLVYGVDSSSGRLLVSGDGGDSWDERPTPGPLIDLVPDPAGGGRLVASSDAGLHASGDGGRSWRPRSGAVGLLAWPARKRLYLVDVQGGVHLSRDGGRRWSRRGTIGGQPAALLAHGADELYAALPDGTVKRSRDGGSAWDVYAGSR